MALKNKKTIEDFTVLKTDGWKVIKVKLTEEKLSDGSEAYNIETSFFSDNEPTPVLTLEDASCSSFDEAQKKYAQIRNSMSVLTESDEI